MTKRRGAVAYYGKFTVGKREGGYTKMDKFPRGEKSYEVKFSCEKNIKWKGLRLMFY